MTETSERDGRSVLNVPLMEATMARILDDPASWNQSMFANPDPCGTTFCFAGHAVLAAGGGYTARDYFTDDQGLWTDPAIFARRALGLTENEADHLFLELASCRDVDVLHRAVKDIIDGRSS